MVTGGAPSERAAEGGEPADAERAAEGGGPADAAQGAPGAPAAAAASPPTEGGAAAGGAAATEAGAAGGGREAEDDLLTTAERARLAKGKDVDGEDGEEEEDEEDEEDDEPDDSAKAMLRHKDDEYVPIDGERRKIGDDNPDDDEVSTPTLTLTLG